MLLLGVLLGLLLLELLLGLRLELRLRPRGLLGPEYIQRMHRLND